MRREARGVCSNEENRANRDLTYRLFNLGVHSQMVGGMRPISPLSILKCSNALVPDKSGKVFSLRDDESTLAS